jgi:hypothetical protein
MLQTISPPWKVELSLLGVKVNPFGYLLPREVRIPITIIRPVSRSKHTLQIRSISRVVGIRE